MLSADWGMPGSEAGFAARVLAGAASRLGPVDVFGPWDPGRRADGAFDPQGIGRPPPGRRWPPEGAPREQGPYRAVLVDGNDAHAVTLAASIAPRAPVLGIGGRTLDGMAACLDLLPTSGPVAGRIAVGLQVPVHVLASERPHLELGPVGDYLLVLSDRSPAASDPATPPEPVAWLVARHPRRHTVLVENGMASVWRSRSCLRRFGVHTRMDLWRLVAHARATVDLGPGPLFGRECVESVRYGVPVVVPVGSGAEGLAQAGAALRVDGTAALLDAVEALDEPATADRLRRAGAALDRWTGEPVLLVHRLAEALDTAGLSSRSPEPGWSS